MKPGDFRDMDPYRRLALNIIWQAIKDKDVDFFYSRWFEFIADALGYSPSGMRELALERIRGCKKKHARRGRRPRAEENWNGIAGGK